MMRLKWEILIGILAMLVGIVFIGWYMSEFEGDYPQDIEVVNEEESLSKGIISSNETPQADFTSVDTPSETVAFDASAGEENQDTDSSIMGSIDLEGDTAKITTQETAVDDAQDTVPMEENPTTAEIIEVTKDFQQSETAVTSIVNEQEFQDNPPSRLQSDDPDLGEWSEGRFVGKMNKDQTDSDLSSSMSIRDEIASALKDHKKPVEPEDAYLTTIGKESSILTVTTAYEDKDLKFTRNTKQVALTESTEEVPLSKGFIDIKPGESLTAIAQRLYKDPNAYAKIYELNKDVIGDPDRILAGQKIRLPAL